MQPQEPERIPFGGQGEKETFWEEEGPTCNDYSSYGPGIGGGLLAGARVIF